ncbi:uncharacterized protein LOC115693014 isoform X1 [Syzygium oleosum]|uniref:uncharacterized protein LOC115693014 isoform X1 n=1 Tax=Syzygium oleosum TaxID=219896 RepID=UPI0024B9074A|nr:uncharacterized protein LOC115693014 isoform X1 [Syzygium oleosum]
MPNPAPPAGALGEDERDPVPSQATDQTQEWEVMAGAWLRAFPEAKEVTATEVEAWIDVNHVSLPSELKSMERSELIERLLSIQNILRLPAQIHGEQEKETTHMNYPPARFQRTDQWIPVYSWLESLDQDDVVKSKDISDWLTDNPEIREQLCSRHSRYHLTHYIKKCHMKILKRRDKQKLLPQAPSINASKNAVQKQAMQLPSNPLNNIPRDSDLYMAKRNEAFQKYEILVALEKQLSTLFPKPQVVNK